MTRWILALLLLVSASSSANAQTSPKRSAQPAAPGGTRKTPAATRQTWEVDTAASHITFSLRHLLSQAEGRFDRWSAGLAVNPANWNDAAVKVVIQAASINTDNDSRDEHLRSSDFFDAEKYPTITFVSTGVKRNGDDLTINGNLTMKGVTKPVVLTGKYVGASTGPNPRMTFRAETTVNRMDYGVSYNRMVEGRGTLLGDDVKVEITVVAVPKS